jgi:hypothetical protein
MAISNAGTIPANKSPYTDLLQFIGGKKMNHNDVEKLDVSLVSGDDGLDRIAILLANALPGDACSALTLTPQQARILATELISAVNRAEVKRSLQTSPNLWRRQGEARPRMATA